MKIININEAGLLLKQDEVLIAQTDTIIGLVCLASSDDGIQKIFDLKQRGSSTPLAILVNSFEMAQRYGQFDECSKELFETLEGQITLIVSVQSEYQGKLGLNNSIGIRYTNSQTLRNLMENINEAVCATSVNKHGEPHAQTLEEAWSIFELPILEISQQEASASNTKANANNNQPSMLLNLTQKDIIKADRINENNLKIVKNIAEKYEKTLVI